MKKKELSIPELMALLSAVLFVLSISCELAYFLVLDSDFFGFLTIADIFKLLLSWLPRFAVVAFGLVLISFFYRTLAMFIGLREELVDDLGDSNGFSINFDKNLKGISRIKNMNNINIIAFLVVFFPFLYESILGSGVSYFVLGVVVVFAWFLFFHIFKENFHFTNGLMRNCFLWGPVFVLVSLTYGAATAQVDLKKKSGDYSATLNDGRQLSNVQLLKSLENGVVLRFPVEERIEYISWSILGGLSKDQAGYWGDKSLMCSLSSKYCDEELK